MEADSMKLRQPGTSGVMQQHGGELGPLRPLLWLIMAESGCTVASRCAIPLMPKN